MAFQITEKAESAASRIVKQPNLVLCIDGVDTKYGAAKIFNVIRVGDSGLTIDGSWVIGGVRELADQLAAVSVENSTSSIKQQLDIDKGRGSSISSLEIGLIDFNGAITELVSPGVVVEDVLGRKAKVLLGFADNTTFPDDYFTIFRGIIDDIKPEQGIIKLNIAHPDQKKRQTIYQKTEHALDGSITNSDTTITLDAVSNMLQKITGPSGSVDSSFKSYVKIDDEIIRYDAISGLDLTGCTRGALGTTAAAHDDEATVESFYRLEGNSIDLALKVMLSGWNDAFVEDVEITNFGELDDSTVIPNGIFFSGVNIEDEYGLTAGDYIQTSGATNGSNNVATWKEILSVTVIDTGSWIEVDGVSYVTELATAGVCKFRSQYDTLPSGCKMSPDEVDISEHLRIQTLFLSSFNFDFYLKDTIDNAQEWIESELYKPSGAYSLPRKARASVGYFIGPLPSQDTKIINSSNVTNPDKLKLRRTINKNFFNTIVYKYEVDPLEDKFLRGVVTQSATSLARIPVGTKALVVESTGMRKDLSGENNAIIASNRRLDRFKFGTEYLEGVQTTYEFGFTVEIGDIMIFDGSELNVIDTATGTREKPPAFFEVINRTLDIKTGKIVVDLLDTNFDDAGRYCLVGPSSVIKTGISNTQFVIEKGFRSNFGASEYKKYSQLDNVRVKVRSSDFTTRFAETYVLSFSGNNVTVADDLGFTPQAGDIMELSNYDFTGVTDEVKLLYGHMATLSGGDDPYQML